jgi:acylphosphatase
MIARYVVHFCGTVEGVGFRHTTARVAGRHDVAGYVRNLTDGRVLVVAEGEARVLETFVRDIERQMAGCVRETSIEKQAATGEFTAQQGERFTVRH